MGKRLLIASLAALCALAVSAVAASGASATATAYTVGSPTAIPAGESTGLALDSLTKWVLTTELFGAELVFTGTGGIDCENCMGQNQASPMLVTGVGGRLLITGVKTNIPGCIVPSITTEPLELEAFSPTSATIAPTFVSPFARIRIEHAKGETCVIEGEYFLEDRGGGVTASISGDVLSVNSSTQLEFNGEGATIKGEATITAGTTGGTYHPVELKSS